jgi:DNA-binding transcriptional LysR family regulator
LAWAQAAGLGAALVPGLALRHVPAEVDVQPLTEPVTERRVFALTRPRGTGPLRPAIDAFLAVLTVG